ncbi:Small secreted domain [Streptomyces zhaozhouensis]|uniref:Small secreted domain n=1 Tax=Streptomyces zhaozhouensis TaxID=1300267 RepID=A0A286DTB0_9ACTN|nr:chaplin [Streptomyces zhaozhouensis]SOD61794.1 Small secreted domain [Streptomyces zhaozhouensis]
MRLRTAAAVTAVACTVVLGAGSAASATEQHSPRTVSDHGDKHDKGDKHGKGGHHSGAGAIGFAAGSPGVLSGNNIQVPIHIPVNVCGNSINIIGLLNPASGNICVNA